MTPATLTTADFLAAYPEFDNADATMVAAKVAQANRHTDADEFDTSTTGVGNDAAAAYAAWLLALSPFGQQAEMKAEVYRAVYDDLVAGLSVTPILVEDA